MPGTCSVDGCESAGNLRRGWCFKHYMRWRRHGDPGHTERTVTLGTVEERFRAKVDRRGPDDCWPWTGHTLRGYGQFQAGTGRDESRIVYAHRFAYELATGEDPGDLFVCHRCDNPPCCNPDHLFLGDNADNMHDMAVKGRHGRTTTTLDQARAVKRMLHEGATQGQIVEAVGVPLHTVKNIRRGTAWRHA